MSTPAGWYPQEDGRQRYWDGSQWTEHFAAGGATGGTAGSAEATSPHGAAAAGAATAQRPWFKKKRVLIPAGLAGVIILGSALGSGGSETPTAPSALDSSASTTASSAPTPSSSAASTPAAPASAAPTTPPVKPAAPKPVAPKPKVVSFSGDGIYDVGSEVKPGLYRSSGGGYWERLKNASGDFEAIIANGNATGQSYVQIKKSDGYFSTNGMDDWVLVTSGATGPRATKFSGDGVYMVGVDIKPGTYKASGDGYWERLKSAGGGFDGIIANGNASGNAIVQIKKTDKFFNTTGMSEWTLVK